MLKTPPTGLVFDEIRFSDNHNEHAVEFMVVK